MKPNLNPWASSASRLGYTVRDDDLSLRVSLPLQCSFRISEMNSGISIEPFFGLLPRWASQLLVSVLLAAFGFVAATSSHFRDGWGLLFGVFVVGWAITNYVRWSFMEIVKNQIFIVRTLLAATETGIPLEAATRPP
jgi:hypothetical protein